MSVSCTADARVTLGPVRSGAVTHGVVTCEGGCDVPRGAAATRAVGSADGVTMTHSQRHRDPCGAGVMTHA